MFDTKTFQLPFADNWDGHGSLAPNPKVIARVPEILAKFKSGANFRDLPWFEPHVGASERGHVTFEWWHGERSLTVFVHSADTLDYLKAWGTDIQAEMEDGEMSHPADFIDLSRWLYELSSDDFTIEN